MGCPGACCWQRFLMATRVPPRAVPVLGASGGHTASEGCLVSLLPTPALAPSPRVSRRGSPALTQRNTLPHPAPPHGLGSVWDCWSNLMESKTAWLGRKTLGRGPDWGRPPSWRMTVRLLFLTTSLVLLVAGQCRALWPRRGLSGGLRPCLHLPWAGPASLLPGPLAGPHPAVYAPAPGRVPSACSSCCRPAQGAPVASAGSATGAVSHQGPRGPVGGPGAGEQTPHTGAS